MDPNVRHDDMRSRHDFVRHPLRTWAVLLLWLWAARVVGVHSSSDVDSVNGDPSCPCLSFEQIDPVDERDVAHWEAQAFLGRNASPSFLRSYGVGCGKHDATTPKCTTENGGGAFCSPQAQWPHKVPCDLSWCHRSWCYVHPANCSLLHRRSTEWKRSDRYVSYATCHEMDSFTMFHRIAQLEGRTIKVAINSNTGGWKGAYQSEKQDFSLNASSWRGPTLAFVRKAAQLANFSLEIVAPPPEAVNLSRSFFSKSSFDLCVYTAALGYADFCAAAYTITNTRALSSSWFLLHHDPVHLIVYTDRTTWTSDMYRKFQTTFQPFTWGAWFAIIVVVIPVMGALLLLHEYGVKGSIFPREEAVMVHEENKDDSSTPQIENRRVHPISYLPKAIYVSFLATAQQAFASSVITLGGMFHLLGFSFFILTIIAVYTANLAAMLTQQAYSRTNAAVRSMDDALQAGYRFCGSRYRSQSVMDLHHIHDRFVRDPVELGGDGLPGFNCAKCGQRLRVFDFLDPVKADTDDRYCHVAIAAAEDLEVLHRDSLHCNKSAVGLPVAHLQTGFPIFEGISKELVSLFLVLKNDRLFERELAAAKPEPTCPVFIDQPGEGSALDISELLGLWFVTTAFALLGLLVTWIGPRRFAVANHHLEMWWKRLTGRTTTSMHQDILAPPNDNDEGENSKSLRGGAAEEGKATPRRVMTRDDSWVPEADTDDSGDDGRERTSSIQRLGTERTSSIQRLGDAGKGGSKKSVRFVTRLNPADQWGMTSKDLSSSISFLNESSMSSLDLSWSPSLRRDVMRNKSDSPEPYGRRRTISSGSEASVSMPSPPFAKSAHRVPQESLSSIQGHEGTSAGKPRDHKKNVATEPSEISPLTVWNSHSNVVETNRSMPVPPLFTSAQTVPQENLTSSEDIEAPSPSEPRHRPDNASTKPIRISSSPLRDTHDDGDDDDDRWTDDEWAGNTGYGCQSFPSLSFKNPSFWSPPGSKNK